VAEKRPGVRCQEIASGPIREKEHPLAIFGRGKGKSNPPTIGFTKQKQGPGKNTPRIRTRGFHGKTSREKRPQIATLSSKLRKKKPITTRRRSPTPKGSRWLEKMRRTGKIEHRTGTGKIAVVSKK